MKEAREKIRGIIPYKLEVTDSARLEAPVSIGEIKEAISSMGKEKSPGPNGITVEFFKINSEWISPMLLDLYQYTLENGSLGPNINSGLIKLLHKGGDKALIKGWRPITLLNVSYKFLAKILASQVAPILQKIINPT
jgi:hypothetical protein